jgi:hypothetical protein
MRSRAHPLSLVQKLSVVSMIILVSLALIGSLLVVAHPFTPSNTGSPAGVAIQTKSTAVTTHQSTNSSLLMNPSSLTPRGGDPEGSGD